MNKKTVKAQVTPGYDTVSLSKREVVRAVFLFIHNREPLSNEVGKLSVTVNENYDCSVEKEWELVLTTNHPTPLIVEKEK